LEKKSIFKLRVVHLGHNPEGEEVTSCVVEPIDEVDVKHHKAQAAATSKPTAATLKALDVLATAIKKHGTTPPFSNTDRIPPDVKCVLHDKWRGDCYQSDMSSGDQDAKQKAFKRASDDLLARKMVGECGGWVWITVCRETQ